MNEKVQAFYAMGNGGIFLSVFPELNLVVVSTAQNFNSGWRRNYDVLLERYILPAVMVEHS